MERRKEINGRLVRWIAEKAERCVHAPASHRAALPPCTAPLRSPGHTRRQPGNTAISPASPERGYEMATGFILEGVGYDIFPMSWKRVLASATFTVSPCQV